MMKLLPHQIEDAELMAAGDLPNFSEAGTGKTLSTLEAIKRSGINNGVVVCPNIALYMWVEELERHLGASVGMLKTGKSPLKGKDFYVLSYGIASNMHQRAALMDWGSQFKGDSCLIADESHYIKTPDSARTKAIVGHAGTGRGGIFDSFGVFWPLTGTPILKYPNDLWSQLRAAHGNELRKYNVETYDKFMRQFCVVQQRQYHPRARPTMAVVAAQNEVLLNKLLYEDIGAVRRSMDEVEVTMPPLTYRRIAVKIPRDNVLTAFMQEIDLDASPEEQPVMAEALHRLGLLKAEGTADYVQELGKQTLVGYWHTDVGDSLEKAFTRMGLRVARVMGGVSDAAKEVIRRAYNAGDIDILVGQISSMNTAWNLQASGYNVVMAEDVFSPSVIEQFIKRVWRIGQKNHVQVDFIDSGHELDALTRKVRERKVGINKRVLDREKT